MGLVTLACGAPLAADVSPASLANGSILSGLAHQATRLVVVCMSYAGLARRSVMAYPLVAAGGRQSAEFVLENVLQILDIGAPKPRF